MVISAKAAPGLPFLFILSRPHSEAAHDVLKRGLLLPCSQTGEEEAQARNALFQTSLQVKISWYEQSISLEALQPYKLQI